MTALEITRKDLSLLVRDRRALIILVALPITFIAIIGATTGKLLGWKTENESLQVGIINRDGSPVSISVVEQLQSRGGLDIVEFSSRSEGELQLKQEHILALMVIGPKLQERVDELSIKDILKPDSGQLAAGLEFLDVEVQTQDDGPVGSIVRQLLMTSVVRTTVPYVARKIPLIRRQLDRDDDPDDETIVPDSAEANAIASATGVVDAVDENTEASRVYRVIVPSYTVLFVFFLVTIMGRSLIQERELGTLNRLRLSPAKPGSIVIGKTLPFLLISLVQTFLLFLFGRLFFGMPWGNHPVWLAGLIFCTSMAATGLGLLFATLVRTDSQVSAYGNLIVLGMAGISGCFMPRKWLPESMKQISLATPHAWALDGYNELLSKQEPILADVAASCFALLLFAGGFLLLGWMRFSSVD